MRGQDCTAVPYLRPIRVPDAEKKGPTAEWICNHVENPIQCIQVLGPPPLLHTIVCTLKGSDTSSLFVAVFHDAEHVVGPGSVCVAHSFGVSLTCVGVCIGEGVDVMTVLLLVHDYAFKRHKQILLLS